MGVIIGPVGMMPSVSVGQFVSSMVMSVGGVEALPPVSTFPVSMAEAAVALSPSAGFTITLWEREEAASSAARRMCKRKVDMSSCGPRPGGGRRGCDGATVWVVVVVSPNG